MIKLSGLSIKNKENRKGDIEIIYKGLRSGEKCEELLIDAEAIKTEHPLYIKLRRKECILSFNGKIKLFKKIY